MSRAHHAHLRVGNRSGSTASGSSPPSDREKPWPARRPGGAPWPVLALCLVLAEPGWGRELRAQRATPPTLSCVTRAAEAPLARTPLLRFGGRLPAGDSVVIHVEWLPAPAGINPQRVEIEARNADARTDCASRRRLVVEMDGAWTSDSVTLRVAGSPAVELEAPGETRPLRVPRPAAGRASPAATRCVIVGGAAGPRLRCGGGARERG